jgi:hypothetical protein
MRRMVLQCSVTSRRPPWYGIVAVIAAACVLPATGYAGKKVPFSNDGVAERFAVKDRLTEVARLQAKDGSFAFHPADDVIARHPCVATIALDIYRHDRDSEFMKQLQAACVRHANFVLANYDRDGDFLLERATWTDRAVEDVGYNALFALDLLSLTQLCVAAEEPVDALFWYQAMRTISGRLIDATWDPDRGVFFPEGAGTASVSEHLALAPLPLYFSAGAGDDITLAVLRNHVLSGPQMGPKRYIDVADLAGHSTGVPAEWALRSALMLGLLSRNGFHGECENFAGSIRDRIAELSKDNRLYTDAREKLYTDYFARLITSGEYTAFVPENVELELLLAVGYMYSVLDLKERRKIEQDITQLLSFLSDESNDTDATTTAMRGVYITISRMREQARVRELFSPRDRQQIPGFDIYGAFETLASDVVNTLKDVENRINDRTGGLSVTSTVTRTTVTKGQAVPVGVLVHSRDKRTEVKSVVLFRGQLRDTLTSRDDGLVLKAGGDPKDYRFHYTIPQPEDGTIQPVQFSIDIQTTEGRRFRYHFDRSVYIRKPLNFEVGFPEGNLIKKKGDVPLWISVNKNVPDPYVVSVQWFSPSGLELVEGSLLEVELPGEMKRTETILHIRAPEFCRPGAFPYTIRIYGNGVEKGTVTGSLFKHYQWLFVGPFPRSQNALNHAYPPERGVNLRARYEGAIQPISWTALPTHAYDQNGELDLTALVPQVSASYLYTVIKTPWEKETTIAFESTAPAAVFVNGSEVLRLAQGGRTRAPVYLDAGVNAVLVKLLSADEKRIFFQLGDEESITPTEFNNNLWELVDGYDDFYARSLGLVGESQQLVTLTYHDPQAASVSVVGSFNNWSPDNAHMRRNEKGEWELNVHLAPGRYAYRFLINNSEQVLDPHAADKEPDGYGGHHSVLVVR